MHSVFNDPGSSLKVSCFPPNCPQFLFFCSLPLHIASVCKNEFAGFQMLKLLTYQISPYADKFNLYEEHNDA